MSNPGVSKLQVLTITGNPTIDAFIRYGLVAAFMFLTGSITGWLNAHGFTDPNLVTYVGLGVAFGLSTIAITAWGLVRTSKNESITRLREAIALQSGINVEASPAPTPQVTVANAQQIIAENATPVAKV